MLVALYARAWVEIRQGQRENAAFCVALYARAWVEIGRFAAGDCTVGSPSTRGRG